MSLTEDDGRWCDLCWDNRAPIIYFREDGTRLDVCQSCDPLEDKFDVYRVKDAYRAVEATVFHPRKGRG